jgi:proline-specific peptidase
MRDMLACLIAASLLASPVPVKEGFLNVEGGQIWYRLVGSGPKTPLIILHGGPGVPHDYLSGMEALAKDRPVLFYDQLGCGKSDRPKGDQYWNMAHFMKELGQVRAELGLKECILYGHSWGTMLATDYKLSGAKGIKGMILSGPALNVNWWKDDAMDLLAQLPAKERKAALSGPNETPAYQAAVADYYSRFLCRRKPWPQNLNDAFAGLGQECYMSMCGPNEFAITGSLKSYDRTQDLDRLHVPVLYLCGEYDEARPATVRRYQRLTPHSQIAVLKGCAHVSMCDNPTAHNAAVSRFLKQLH